MWGRPLACRDASEASGLPHNKADHPCTHSPSTKRTSRAGTSSAAPRPASARPRSRRCSPAIRRPRIGSASAGCRGCRTSRRRPSASSTCSRTARPTHVDLFDYKPELTKRQGQAVPDSVVKGARFSTMTGGQTVRPCLPEITKFAQHGQERGVGVSDFLPHTAAIADDLCFVKSMHTDAGEPRPGHLLLPHRRPSCPAGPSMGSVAHLRPRQRDRRTARLRGDDLTRQGSDLRADLLRLLLGQRVPADQVPGREVPRQRRPGAVPVEPRRHEPRQPPRRCSTTSRS